MRDVTAIINLKALSQNLERIRELSTSPSIWAMVKSNGYGHGLQRVALQLEAADLFGVACVEEAIILREAGIKQPIVVMIGFMNIHDLPAFENYNLSAVIHTPEQISILEKAKQAYSFPLWLKLDTGMHRLGFAVNKAKAMNQQLLSFNTQVGLMTHLACADTDAEFSTRQIKVFHEAVEAFAQPKSVVNSAGIIACPEAHYDVVRPGIMLYGVSPFAEKRGEDLGLQPVMTLKARLIDKKNIAVNEYVGYGATWQSQRDTLIGVVAIGYGDGYPRHAKNGTPVLIDGKYYPLAGRVSMDMITVDLTDNPNIEIGAEVTLWGEGLPVEVIAQHADTIGYELLCGVTQRVKFVESEF